MTGNLPLNRRKLSRIAFPVSLAMSALMVLAVAAPSQAQLNPKLRKCRTQIAQHVRKVAALVISARSKCVAQKIRGALGPSVDCLADPPIFGGPGTGDLKTDERLAIIADITGKQAAKIEGNCAATASPADMHTRLDAFCTPEELGAYFRAESDKWGKVIRDLNVTLE
jgi:hypothetical protein